MKTVDDLQHKTKEELVAFVAEQSIKMNEQASKIAAQQAEIDQQAIRIQTLHNQLGVALNARFGRKSEKQTVSGMDDMFDEAVVPVDQVEQIKKDDEALTVASYQRTKKAGGRKPLPTTLPRRQIIHDVSDAEKICTCGCTLTCIDEVKSEQLEIIPAVVTVIEHVRLKYACKACELTIKTAPVAKQPIPKSIATPSLLAHIAVSKFDDHLPLYRLEEIFNRHGVDVSRMTLSSWMIRCGELVQPLINLLQDHINNYDIAYADETPVQVLQQKVMSPIKKSYMWLFTGGPPEKRCYLYHYEPSRASHVPAMILDSFKGYLHCDAYSGYLPLFVTRPIIGVGCLAHIRRKFVDITKTVKTKGLAHEAVAMIAQLYKLEKEMKEKELDKEACYACRQEHAVPLLNQLHAWLIEKSQQVPPKSPIGQAIQYALNRWIYLLNYLKDGRLEIDNNRSERGIKPFVIGRKNWLFFGNYKGAKAAAHLFSLIESAKANGLNPFDYLKEIFEKLPHCQTVEDFEALLPFKIQPTLEHLPEKTLHLQALSQGG